MKILRVSLVSILALSFLIVTTIGVNAADKMACPQKVAKTGKYNLYCAKQTTAITVKIAAEGLGGILKNVKDEKERVNIIQNFIDPIRFYADKSGYFYVYDSKGVNIAHATQKELVGKNLMEHKDSKGKSAVKELLDAAKKGGGFVEFYWVKPGDKGEKKKIGYAEMIPETDYFIGSGVYLH